MTESQEQLLELDQESEQATEAPKKKTARKRATATKKRATKKTARKKAKAEPAPKTDESGGEKPAEANADTKPAEQPNEPGAQAEESAPPAPKPPKAEAANEDVPETFSAGPDDLDERGDVSRQNDRRSEDFDTEEYTAASGKSAREPKPADEAPKTESRSSSDKDEAARGKSGGDFANGPNRDKRDGGDQRERGNQGGFPKKDKFDKLKNRDKNRQPGGGSTQGGNPQHGNNRHQGGGKKGKFKQKGKKGGWQGSGAFSAAEDDINPPVFDAVLEDERFHEIEQIEGLAKAVPTDASEWLAFEEINALKLPELEERLREFGGKIDGPPSRAKLMRALLDQVAQEKRPLICKGILELVDDGYGFITFATDSYRLKTNSPFVPEALVENGGLQRGHEVEVQLIAPLANDTTPVVVSVRQVMGADPAAVMSVTPFKELTAYYPTERILLECKPEEVKKWDNISMRVVDLLTPVGLGQRGLIVAPPRTGKTVLLQGIANAITINKPDVHLIILLVDERPEEVTDFKRTVKGAEVISSTFDEAAESHVHAAEMVIEKARRMVECKRDVVILLDSITRLARAYNTLMPSSGKILSGGVEANALQKPKRFFGSARKIEEGGSLTILGTALVETGSKMDEVIFEEFKGTGNMELNLDRELSNKRVFPALSFEKSGTRKEELLYHPDEMQKVYSLRRAMKGVPSTEAMEMLITRVKKSRTNAEFLMGLNR